MGSRHVPHRWTSAFDDHSLIAFSLKGSSGGQKSPHSVSTSGTAGACKVAGKVFVNWARSASFSLFFTYYYFFILQFFFFSFFHVCHFSFFFSNIFDVFFFFF